MRTRILFSVAVALASTLAGCARNPMVPGLVCVPSAQAPPYAAAGSWYCQEVAVTVREPGPEVAQHRTGAFADLIVGAMGRCPDRAGSYVPSVTVKNIGPVAAGAFNVEVDISVFDGGGTPVATTGAVGRIAGLAPGAEAPVPFDRLPGVTVQAGDRLTLSAIVDPQQVPGGAMNVFGEILELDETNNSAVQNCTVPSG